MKRDAEAGYRRPAGVKIAPTRQRVTHERMSEELAERYDAAKAIEVAREKAAKFDAGKSVAATKRKRSGRR